MVQPVRAILFDLDGTLLDNDMNLFLPRYFDLLTAHMEHLLPREEFMSRLMRATRKMLGNDGSRTNEEAFAADFYPLAGHSREKIEPLLLEFYAEKFPTLRQYTRPVPQARQVVEMAFDLGYTVAITTNPLFPATAVQQRMEWAGVAGLPYRLVTSYENSRATKPNLLYFEQTLDALGQPPQASLVVGDEDMDMVAALLGCQTFLVPGPRTELAAGTPPPTYEGRLAGVGDLLQSWHSG
jgi:FMN phosphatase YigB (HAD superfamily)